MANKLSSQDASRVVDFMNDKIQTTTDLQNLDALLSSLEEKQDLQRKQVYNDANGTMSRSEINNIYVYSSEKRKKS